MYSVGLIFNNNIILATNTISVVSGHLSNNKLISDCSLCNTNRLSNALLISYITCFDKKYVVSTVELCGHPIGVCIGSVTTGIDGRVSNMFQNVAMLR